MAQRPRRAPEQSNILMKDLARDLALKKQLTRLHKPPSVPMIIRRELEGRLPKEMRAMKELEDTEARIASAVQTLHPVKRILVRTPEEVEALCEVRRCGWTGDATIPNTLLPRKRSEMLLALQHHGFNPEP